MKVGIFSDTYFPQVSGVSTSIKTLKEALEEQGHQVYIFTTTDPNAEDFEAGVIRLPSIPFWSFKDRRIAVRGKRKALKLAESFGLDIVHTQTEFTLGFIGKYVADKLAIPHIHTYHTMYEDYLHYIAGGRVIRPQHVANLSRYFCNAADGVIAPSKKVELQLHQYGVYTPIKIIPTGIQLSRFAVQRGTEFNLREELSIPSEAPVVLSLSRLSKEKNIQAIIHSMPYVLEKLPNARLVIVGDGPQREELEELVHEQNLAESVNFVGQKESNQVSSYYQQADVFVSASESESQGLTYIEAISSGTPIVAKMSEYTSSLVGARGEMGSLFVQDSSLPEVLLKELEKAKASHETENFREAILKEISSETFVGRVTNFYELTAENKMYQEKII